MSSISKDDKALASAIAATFGGVPRVTRYYDDPRTHSIDILRAVDRPQAGVTSWSTVGLYKSPLYLRDNEYPARVEIVGACGSAFEDFGSVLATAAFNIAKDRWFCAPGVIFPDVVKMYRPSGTMRHGLFVPPFLWDSLRTLKLGGRDVAFLLLVPISEGECKLAEAEGPAQLEALFEKEQIDIFDIDRPSAV
ncbi:MAG: suppressor of fused domain protein [Anaeromyxobacteraceae bacterium]